MDLRILSGQYKGRRLQVPKGEIVRPTTGKLRAALFNILQQEIEGSHFLELFAGTGAVSLEALSRGAASALLVESHPEACRAIRANLDLLQAETGQLVQSDVFRALERLKDHRFDVIFADPPYEKGLAERLLLYLDGSSFLKEGGRLFLEAEELEVPSLSHLELRRSRRFGSSFLYEFSPS